MADKNNQTEAAENLSQLLQIRRDKLKQLQESGNDPFTITRFVSDNDSGNIKENLRPGGAGGGHRRPPDVQAGDGQGVLL